MPFQETETDEQFLDRVGADPRKWAEAYAKMPHDREYPDRLVAQLEAWFHHAIQAGRNDVPSPFQFGAALPVDDRWFFAWDPTLDPKAYRTAPWVVATRCDNGFTTEEGHFVHPQRWAPLPEPVRGTGWRWPTGSIELASGRIEEMGWTGFIMSIVGDDGAYDETREPWLCNSQAEAKRRAAEFAAWSGLPIIEAASFNKFAF